MSSRDPNLCVRVTNLSKLLKEAHLRELFECCGRISSCTLTTENGARVCLVEYDDAAHAKAASFLNGTPLGDLNLNVVLLSDYLAAKAPPLPAAAMPPPLPPAQGVPPPMNGLPGLLAGMVPPPPPVPAAIPPLSVINPVLSAMIANGTAPPVPPVLAAAGLNPIQAAANAALLERSSNPQPLPPPPMAVAPLSGASAALAMAAADPNNQVSAAAKARIDEVARTVYVGNISHSLTEDHLRTFFLPIGPILYVKLAGEMNGVRYGFVEYEKLEHANLALGLSGRVLGDRPLKVGKAHNPIIKTEKGHADNAAFIAANKPGPTVDKAEAAKRAMEALKKLTNKVTGVADPADDKKRKSSRSRSPGKSNGSSSRRKSSRSRSPRGRGRSPSPRSAGAGGMYSSRYGRDVREFVGHDYQTSTGAFAHRSGWRDYRAGASDADRERERADRDRYYADRDRERADRDRSDRDRGSAKSSSSSSAPSSSSSSSSSSSRSRKDDPHDRSGMFWDGFMWNPLPGGGGAAGAGAGAPLSAAKHEKYQKSAQYDAERGRAPQAHDKPATHSH